MYIATKAVALSKALTEYYCLSYATRPHTKNGVMKAIYSGAKNISKESMEVICAIAYIFLIEDADFDGSEC